MTVADGTLVTIRDAQLIWRNFEGRETRFKPAGTRTVNVVLDEDVAEQMAKDGWNVRCKPPRDEDDVELCTLEIGVGYNYKPPRVVMITSTSRLNLGEDTVGVLDFADIGRVDLIIRAYHWHAAGKEGIKAYLKTMFVTIDEDELEREYGINEVGVSSLEKEPDQEEGDPFQ